MLSALAAFDWNHLRSFLVTAESGSLAAAAKALGSTQPTLSRQVAALEAGLGLLLFDRQGKRLRLTPSGRALLEPARQMATAAAQLELIAAGLDQRLEGLVTVTATEQVARQRLPAVLQELARIAPGITVEIIASNAVQDLTKREADISIRHARPEQPDLIARRLGSVFAHLYASQRYLAQVGPLNTLASLQQVRFISFDRSAQLTEALAAHGLVLRPDQIVAYAANGSVVLAMLRADLGISILTDDLLEPADAQRLVAVLPTQFAIEVPVWLVAHRELHSNQRIRLLFDLIARLLAPAYRPDAIG